MAYQVAGDNPYDYQIGAYAMFSDSSFSSCPSWDHDCSSDPLINLNALSNHLGVPASNGEAAGNNVWLDNSYAGPWAWSAYVYGNCSGGGLYMPTDPTTGSALTASACGPLSLSQWQADWQQDAGSTMSSNSSTTGSSTGSGTSGSPPSVSFSGLAANSYIHSKTQAIDVSASANDGTGGSISNCKLIINSTTVATDSSSPYDFSLSTLTYSNGALTITASCTDNQSNVTTQPISVIVNNGDLNNDGSVNISDLAIMAEHWGETDSNYTDGNITGQTNINISDLSVLAVNWGWSKS
jgi:hypothetical protein